MSSISRKTAVIAASVALVAAGGGTLSYLAANDWSWGGGGSPSVVLDSLSFTPIGSQTEGILKIHSSGASVSLQDLTIAVRDQAGNNLDYPGTSNPQIPASGYTFAKTKLLAPGSYTVYGAYEQAGTWHNLASQTLTVPVSGPSPSPTPSPSPSPTPSPTPTPSPSSSPTGGPNGPAGPWTLKFSDDFSGTAVDTSKWSFQSTAESDWSSSPLGTGNPGNQQLEFDQPANCTVANGSLDIHGKPDSITSQSGKHYNFSSCMLNSSPSFSFQYGYMEFRAQLPGPVGWWNSGWSWSKPGANLGSANGETDDWENYSDQHSRFYLTQHTPPGGANVYTAPFDGSTGYHTYGVDIEPSGTTWYIDGVKAGNTVPGTSNGQTNVLIDMFAYNGNGNTSLQPTVPADMLVDYVKVWQH